MLAYFWVGSNIANYAGITSFGCFCGYLEPILSLAQTKKLVWNLLWLLHWSSTRYT